MLNRFRTLTSHNAEESENSPESPPLGEIKRMRKQFVPGGFSVFRARRGRGQFNASHALHGAALSSNWF